MSEIPKDNLKIKNIDDTKIVYTELFIYFHFHCLNYALVRSIIPIIMKLYNLIDGNHLTSKYFDTS